MLYLNKPVAYLQDSDFDSKGNIVNPEIPNNIPVLIMIQAKFCGFCTKAKPDFQKFANENVGKVFCATIEGDGNQPGESELSKSIKKVYPNFRGYPSYVAYKNRKRLKIHDGGRNISDLKEFMKNL